MSKNLHKLTVDSFGDEWARFDQSAMSEGEAATIFEDYFRIFPWEKLPANPTGFDMGCGSGRWAARVAPRVGHLHCIDPSAAIDIAKRTLSAQANVSFHRASVDDQALPLNSQDFGYSLGVLHHIPDTAAAMRSCAAMLKPGAPLLVYLYYALDNRPLYFKLAWRCADWIRRTIHRLPGSVKHFTTDLIAATIYFPLARGSWLVEKLGFDSTNLPLSYYRDRSFYTMRTDSRDRFGTPLEQRFTRQQIRIMMQSAGLGEIRFSSTAPYWCSVGIKR
jgi:SAM-dependent methyltransferase